MKGRIIDVREKGEKTLRVTMTCQLPWQQMTWEGWLALGSAAAAEREVGAVKECGGDTPGGGKVVSVQGGEVPCSLDLHNLIHLCLGLCMGSETNHKNLRVLCTGNRTLFKANFTVEYYFSFSFFFFLNTESFLKASEVLKITAKHEAGLELFLVLWLHSTFILDLPEIEKYCQPLLQIIKNKQTKDNFRDAKVKVIHPWSDCTVLIL